MEEFDLQRRRLQKLRNRKCTTEGPWPALFQSVPDKEPPVTCGTSNVPHERNSDVLLHRSRVRPHVGKRRAHARLGMLNVPYSWRFVPFGDFYAVHSRKNCL